MALPGVLLFFVAVVAAAVAGSVMSGERRALPVIVFAGLIVLAGAPT